MCLGVKTGDRMEKVADGYAQVASRQHLEQVFKGWRQAVEEAKEQHRLKEELVEVSLQLKQRSLLIAIFEAIQKENQSGE